MASNDDNGSENDSCNCNKNKRPQNYPVFTNPLDMERFFSQQMDEIVKSFGIFGSFFQGFPEFPPTQYPEHQPNDQNNCEDEKGSRDFMLKKGSSSRSTSEFPEYHEPRTGIDSFKLDLDKDIKQNQKIDMDLDRSGVNSEDLDKLYRQPQENRPPGGLVPFFDHEHKGPRSLFGQLFGYNSPFPDPMIKPQVPSDDGTGQNWTTRSFSFGQSTSRSQYQLPDGSIEERTESSDSQGNKVNKVTKTARNGEWYCKTCITKPGGEEECQEESSQNYQPSENESNLNSMDEGSRGFSRWYQSYEFVSNYGQGRKTENLAGQMIEKEKKIRESLLDTLKHLW